jgi:hypothetical protein
MSDFRFRELTDFTSARLDKNYHPSNQNVDGAASQADGLARNPDMTRGEVHGLQ